MTIVGKLGLACPYILLYAIVRNCDLNLTFQVQQKKCVFLNNVPGVLRVILIKKLVT